MKKILNLELLYFTSIVLYSISIIFVQFRNFSAQIFIATILIASSLLLFKKMNEKAQKIINTYQLNVREETEKKDTFVATIIHDLKNPLIAQARMLENLIRKKQREQKEAEAELLTSMLSSSRLLFEMVCSIMNTYKYSECDMQFQFKKLNIINLLKNVCSELTYLTVDKNLIEININSTEEIVVADELHLRRVITNLVSNAIHYRKDDTSIKIELNSTRDEIIFKVINKGYYILPEKRKELFEKYISKASKFNSFGTGLGLYISEKIIKAHKGEMFVDSLIDGTNTFGFKLPLIHFTNFVDKKQKEEKIIEV